MKPGNGISSQGDVRSSVGPSGLGLESERTWAEAGWPSVRDVRDGICARYPLFAPPPFSPCASPEVDLPNLQQWNPCALVPVGFQGQKAPARDWRWGGEWGWNTCSLWGHLRISVFLSWRSQLLKRCPCLHCSLFQDPGATPCSPPLKPNGGNGPRDTSSKVMCYPLWLSYILSTPL